MSELNGFFCLRTAYDLRTKLEVDYNRLRESKPASIEAQYAALDFFVCAEHIPDWLTETEGGSKTRYRSYPEGAIVSHIANGAKHFRVKDTRHAAVKGTSTSNGIFDEKIFDPSIFDCAPRLVIELEDGTVIDVLELATQVISHWRIALPEKQ